MKVNKLYIKRLCTIMDPYHYTVAINELLCLKNAGAQISLFFISYE
jgi:hypothetical protein